MGDVVRRFIPRAPRYVLRPSDAQFLYFAKESQRGSKFPTRIVNVSESGIAFLVERSLSPALGQTIKIEFPVPSANRIAWFARVVRLEEWNESRWWNDFNDSDSMDSVLVAVTYQDLPEGHRREIHDGLWTRYQELVKEDKRRARQRFLEFLREHFWSLILFGLCVVTSALALYWFTSLEPLFDIREGSMYRRLWEGWDF